MFFSVIIPTYNRAALLGEALKSVFAQTFKDYEIIVVDDGSTDGTEEMLAGLAGKVRYYRQENKGPGAARNLGIYNAAGDYVAFLDSDDVWLTWTLEVYAEAITENAQPNFVTGHGEPREQEFEITSGQWPRRFLKTKDFLELSEIRYGFAGTPGMTVKTQVVRMAGGFVDRFINGEDQDLCLRLGTAPGFVYIESPPVYLQRTDATHVSRDLDKSIAGINLLLEREHAGVYPGGPDREKVRRGIIGSAARSVSINCAKEGNIPEALRLYQVTFGWQWQQGRWKYLLGFHLFILTRMLKSKRP